MQEKITIETALAHILMKVRSETSETFFPSMALRLAEALKADYTEIGELPDDRTVRTLSLTADGNIIENITYPLADTPCDNVAGKTVCSYPSGVADLFPKDRFLRQRGVEGYVGVPLFDTQQRPIGIMAAFYRSPLTDPSLAETILQLFALRVASEIERRRTEELLIRTRARFNTLYDHNPVPLWEEDFSRVKEYFDSLRASGVSELRSYFDAHPETVMQCAGLVKINDVSQESVAFFNAANKEDVIRNLQYFFTEESLPIFRDELVALWEGKVRFDCEISIRDMQRKERTVSLRLSIAPGHELTWDMVLVSFSDITARKRAEETLKESERRYRDLFEANPHPMWVYDVETLRFLSVNDAAVGHYGYSRDEFLSMTIADIRPAQDMPHLWNAIKRGAKNPGVNKTQVRHRKRDGTLITVEITSHALDFDGRRARLITANDITERTRAEEALKKSEALYHDLVSTSQDLIWQCDAEGKYVYLNPSWETVFGYTIEEMIGKNFTDFQSPETAGNDIREFARLIQGNTVTGFETTHIGKDGRHIQLVFSAKAVYDAQGKVVGTRGTAYDITERKRAEEALQESERKYRDLVETSQDLIWMCDAKGRFTYLNPAWERVLGYKIEEMLGRRFGDFQIPDIAARDVQEFKQHLGDSSIMGYETIYRSRSGKDVSLIFNAKSLRDSAGAIRGTQGTAFDITDHKKTEEKASADHRRMVSLLKISQSKTSSLKELLDQALHEAVALSESRLGYIYNYNEEKKEFTLHGWSNAVMKECAISDPRKIYRLEDTGIWGEAVRQRGAIIVNDFYAPHPLKRGYPKGHALLHRFMTLPVFIEGRIVAVVGVANKQLEYDEQDVLQLASMMDSILKIAEHRRMVEDLRKLSQAVEQSPASIVITDAKGNIEFVNPRFTQVTGFQAGEVLGMNPRVLKSGETPPERYKELWETITAGKVWEGEFHNKKKNGELFWEHAAISPIRDGGGSITHYLGIKEDITERKKLEDQLRQAQKMEAIGQLAGGVAHDFNNILSTITGYASLLEMSITSDATLRDYVAEITVASERGANLTQSLLAFSRKQEASLAAVDLNDQIRSSHKVLSRLVGEDIDLVLDLDREDTVVEADAGQLQQVLMNLASNARDAMRNGGTLRIATKNVTIGGDHEERYALEHPGKYAILSMIDTGAGMEQAVRERIFEPFYTTKGVGKGTGLGLSIVYGIVKKHRGSITVDSEPGKGTVFNIYLPRTERSIRGRGADEALPQAAAGNRTILLVEDEETVRRVLRLTLEAYGYRVIEAVDGEDAVRVFRENQAEILLVLCDLVMPKKNGRQACEEMTKIRPDVKTVFMSGYTKDIFDQKGISESDITLLVKPINPKDLVNKISEVLEGTHRPT